MKKLILFILVIVLTQPLTVWCQPTVNRSTVPDFITSGPNNQNFQIQNPVQPKSANELKYFIDSSYTYYYSSFNDSALRYRNYFKFDTKGYQTNFDRYNFDINHSAWFLAHTMEISYDTKGNIISSNYLYTSYYNGEKLGEKEENTYTSNNNFLQSKHYQWIDSTETWLLVGQTENTYDLSDRLTGITNWEWDYIAQELYINSKYKYSYDNKGNPDTIEYSQTDYPSHVLENYSREIRAYNGDNLEDSTYYFSWDKNSDAWNYISKSQKIYNPDEKIIKEYSYNWDVSSDAWIGNSYSEYNYDANGNQTLSSWYYWNPAKSIWSGSSKTETTYDPQSRILEITYFNWNDSTDQWLAIFKADKEYSQGLSYTETKYEYSTELLEWINHSKIEYEYDGQLFLSYIQHEWDNLNSVWVNFWKSQSDYDKNGNEILNDSYQWDATNEVWKGYDKHQRIFDDYNNLLVYESDAWIADLASWVPNYKEFNYYTSREVISTVKEDLTDNSFTIYPNPFSDGLSVELNSNEKIYPIEVELLDLSGRIITAQSGISLVQINTAQLDPAIYFIKVNYLDSSFVRKIVKH